MNEPIGLLVVIFLKIQAHKKSKNLLLIAWVKTRSLALAPGRLLTTRKMEDGERVPPLKI